eukprot:5528861-Prymnesium_polylepis.1
MLGQLVTIHHEQVVGRRLCVRAYVQAVCACVCRACSRGLHQRRRDHNAPHQCVSAPRPPSEHDHESPLGVIYVFVHMIQGEV